MRILVLLWPALLLAQGSIPVIIGRSVPLLPPAVDAAGRTVVTPSSVDASGATSEVMDLYTSASDGSGLRRLTKLSGSGYPPQGVNSASLSPDGARAAFT